MFEADGARPVVHWQRRSVFIYAVEVIDGSAGITAKKVPSLVAGAAVVVIPNLTLTGEFFSDARDRQHCISEGPQY